MSLKDIYFAKDILQFSGSRFHLFPRLLNFRIFFCLRVWLSSFHIFVFGLGDCQVFKFVHRIAWFYICKICLWKLNIFTVADGFPEFKDCMVVWYPKTRRSVNLKTRILKTRKIQIPKIQHCHIMVFQILLWNARFYGLLWNNQICRVSLFCISFIDFQMFAFPRFGPVSGTLTVLIWSLVFQKSYGFLFVFWNLRILTLAYTFPRI